VRYLAYSWFWKALDWLYPPTCGGCRAAGDRWCAKCQANTNQLAPPLCPICGQQSKSEALCFRCQKKIPQYTAIRSWAIFGGMVRNAIHQLKYRGNLAFGDTLAYHLIELLETLNWHVNLVVPVPLGVARRKERGYNQAALLAYPLALRFKIPYRENALWRIRETQSQVSLSRQERQQNVSDAFEASPKFVSGKTVLVVDDVTTSGATLDACASALLQADASKVYGLTLARAEFVSAE
jgi:competence protein ComFC